MLIIILKLEKERKLTYYNFFLKKGKKEEIYYNRESKNLSAKIYYDNDFHIGFL